jgi:hypothetical protein
MNKLIFNIVTDLLAAASLTVMVATGVVIWFVLPPGTNRSHWLWGMMRHEWGTLHAAASVVLLAAITVHVALHWRWLVTNLCKRAGLGAWAAGHGRLAGALVVLLLVIPLGVFGLAAALSARELPLPLHMPIPTDGPDPSAAPIPKESLAAAKVLAERCAGCHHEQRAMGGVLADTPEELRRPQRGVRWVLPGDPDSSPLFGIIGDETAGSSIAPMHVLSTQELAVLREWVSAIAPEAIEER